MELNYTGQYHSSFQTLQARIEFVNYQDNPDLSSNQLYNSKQNTAHYMFKATIHTIFA